jgi:exo-beta-1,3-glucanase (GH17 family)
MLYFVKYTTQQLNHRIGNNANYLTEVKTLTHTLSSNKLSSSYISGVLVGNEILFNKVMSASQLASKINDVKSKVKSHGLMVGTCEIPSSFSSATIKASDFLVVNIHPYFGQVPVSQAANNLVLQYNALKNTVKGKPLIVGETGWPTAGASNGQSVPSTHNLQTYVNDIQCIDKSIKYYFFDSVDTPWKAPGVEQHWGLWKSNGGSKGLKFKTSCHK